MHRVTFCRLVMMSVMLCMVSGAMASPAPALTTNGPGAFSATAPPSRFVISPTGGTPFALTCQVTQASGSLAGPGPFTPPANLTPSGFTLMFQNCSAFGNPFTYSCAGAASTLWATGNPVAGVTPVELRGLSCHITLASFPNCRITLSPWGGAGTRVMSGSYSNATDQLTINSANQALVATWSTMSGGSCPWITPVNGHGSAVLTNTSGGNLVFTVTSAFKPDIQP